MSDFGTVLLFKKTDGSAFSDGDFETIKTQLKAIVEGDDPGYFEIAEGDYLDLKEWGEGEYCSMLQEYYIDEDEEEIREGVEEIALPDAEEIAEKLKEGLAGIHVEVRALVEDW